MHPHLLFSRLDCAEGARGGWQRANSSHEQSSESFSHEPGARLLPMHPCCNPGRGTRKGGRFWRGIKFDLHDLDLLDSMNQRDEVVSPTWLRPSGRWAMVCVCILAMGAALAGTPQQVQPSSAQTGSGPAPATGAGAED